MINKNFILTADGLGFSGKSNLNILDSGVNGFLSAISLSPASEAFDNAVNDVLPDLADMDVGVYLNITNGMPLSPCNFLTDNAGKFNSSLLKIFLNRNDKKFLFEIENEFLAQIKEVINHSNPKFIASYQNIHMIPELFDIVCKLAKMCNIPYVRTCYNPYYTKKNFLSLFVLNALSAISSKSIKSHSLRTNTYMLNTESYSNINHVLEEILTSCITEVVIPPSDDENSYSLSKDKTFFDTVSRLGFDVVNYKKIL